MSQFEKQVYVFYQMICNAFRDEDDYETAIEKLSFGKDGDMNELIVAMMTAMQVFCSNVAPESMGDMDTIGFTHALNRLAIQHFYAKDDEGTD